MTIRIVSPQYKITAVVVFYVLAVPIIVFFGMAFGTLVTFALLTIAQLVALLFFTRTFRGSSEDTTKPRPWWRLTEKPTAGIVIGCIFALQTVSLLAVSFTESYDALNLVTIVINVMITGAFFNSSLKIRRLIIKNQTQETR
ncbi:hypothetical protein [Lysinibacter sp. HNR]|uniref:hypothetical protein n=1 Tax=Lysinibacter sp. HNR TaxID=3031408 RepID=UPI002435045E|nr:hypothetical protein [Lysinibacter sp. HNR]WGD37689.1 hypothetical protein FrondiHNR_01890 [Lysinibacter sp. HNR]